MATDSPDNPSDNPSDTQSGSTAVYPPGSESGPYRAECFSSDNNLGYLLKQAQIALANSVDQQLIPYGLTYPQFVILMRLSEGTSSTAAELAREVNTDTGAMTRMLDRLESKGIVRRVRCDQDRRVCHLKITEEGQSAVADVRGVAIQVLNRYFGDFSSEEIAFFASMLKRIIARSKE